MIFTYPGLVGLTEIPSKVAKFVVSPAPILIEVIFSASNSEVNTTGETLDWTFLRVNWFVLEYIPWSKCSTFKKLPEFVSVELVWEVTEELVM